MFLFFFRNSRLFWSLLAVQEMENTGAWFNRWYWLWVDPRPRKYDPAWSNGLRIITFRQAEQRQNCCQQKQQPDWLFSLGFSWTKTLLSIFSRCSSSYPLPSVRLDFLCWVLSHRWTKNTRLCSVCTPILWCTWMKSDRSSWSFNTRPSTSPCTKPINSLMALPLQASLSREGMAVCSVAPLERFKLQCHDGSCASLKSQDLPRDTRLGLWNRNTFVWSLNHDVYRYTTIWIYLNLSASTWIYLNISESIWIYPSLSVCPPVCLSFCLMHLCTRIHIQQNDHLT